MSIDEDYDGDYYNSDDDDGIYDYIPEENINIPNKTFLNKRMYNSCTPTTSH